MPRSRSQTISTPGNAKRSIPMKPGCLAVPHPRSTQRGWSGRALAHLNMLIAVKHLRSLESVRVSAGCDRAGIADRAMLNELMARGRYLRPVPQLSSERTAAARMPCGRPPSARRVKARSGHPLGQLSVARCSDDGVNVRLKFEVVRMC